jgi:hypothetical protein
MISSWKRDQHLASLMATLLHARLLIFDVVAWYADLDEAADQIAHVSVTSVARVRIGDDEGAIIVDGSLVALLLAHASALEMLVLVGCQQSAHN